MIGDIFMRNKKIVLFFMLVILIISGCQEKTYTQDTPIETIPSETNLNETIPNETNSTESNDEDMPIWEFDVINDSDQYNVSKDIYFTRENDIYKYNEKNDNVEFYMSFPTENTYRCVINDKKSNIIYYGTRIKVEGDQDKYDFYKRNMTTQEDILISNDVGVMGEYLYDSKIYFYDFLSGCITKYDIETNEFYKFETSYEIDGNGSIEIYNGKIYFYSSRFHQISINDMGTRLVAKKHENYFIGYLYNNYLFYTDKIDDDNACLIKLDLDSFEKTIIDSFELQLVYDDFWEDTIKDVSIYVLAYDNKVYYSYNHETYCIGINGEGKEKIADFPIRGDMYIRSNKLLWYYAEGQDTPMNNSITDDMYKLQSFDLETKQVKEYIFK